MRIRIAEEKDAEATCRVLRQSIEKLCVADHENDAETLDRWLANKTPDNVRTWIVAPGVTVMVAEQDEAIVGVGAVSTSGNILLNYVSPQARFRGVSKAVLAAMEENLRQTGHGQCRLESSRTAHRFYRAAGYRDAGDAQIRGNRSSQPMVKML